MLKTTLNLILATMGRGPWPHGGKQKTRAKKTLARLARFLFQSAAPLPATQNPPGLELNQRDWLILIQLGQAPGNRLTVKELGQALGASQDFKPFPDNCLRLAAQGLIYLKTSFKTAGFGLEITDAGRLALLLKTPRP